MRGFIDIHNHMLPGLDDGARSPDQAFSMLKAAVEQGFSGVVATPHFKPDRHIRKRHLYGDTLKWMQEMAQMHFPGFRIFGGNEIFFYQDVLQELETGNCHTMGGTDYVLVEFHPSEDYQYIRNAVNLLTGEGYRPILAHVERYQALEQDMERVWEMIDMGSLLQVNARSVERGGGFLKGSFVKKLLKERAVHFLATDAHDMESRSPVLGQCRKNLEKWCSSDYIKQITVVNPRLMLKNAEIE